jgi:hypothetical protein
LAPALARFAQIHGRSPPFDPGSDRANVLADVSIPNGNVYYEVGIRHAAQRQGCVMTAATWSKPLFDIDQMRQIRYPLPNESISVETAAEIINIIETAIPLMSAIGRVWQWSSPPVVTSWESAVVSK